MLTIFTWKSSGNFWEMWARRQKDILLRHIKANNHACDALK